MRNRTDNLRLACGNDAWALGLQNDDGSVDAAGLHMHCRTCPDCRIYLQALTVHMAQSDPEPPRLRQEVQQEYLTVRQTATLMGMSQTTVRRYIRAGVFPHYRLWDGTTIRLKRSDVEEFMAGARIQD